VEEELSEVRDFFACRMCRRVLFTDRHLVQHDVPAETAKNFNSDFGKPRVVKSHVVSCTSHFITPVPSLGDFSNPDGKIVCPKCQSRLGTYVWSGAQCSCGQWVVPSLQIIKSKVDQKPLAAAGASRAPVRPVAASSAPSSASSSSSSSAAASPSALAAGLSGLVVGSRTNVNATGVTHKGSLAPSSGVHTEEDSAAYNSKGSATLGTLHLGPKDEFVTNKDEITAVEEDLKEQDEEADE